MATATSPRPIPRCCGYCQSREIRPHCSETDGTLKPGCFWVLCKTCNAVSCYTKAVPRTREQDGLTWRLIHQGGQRRYA